MTSIVSGGDPLDPESAGPESPTGVLALRARVWRVLEGDADQGSLARRIDVGLSVLIVLNLVAIILESMAELRALAGSAFRVFEVFSISVFALEYAARLWSSPADARYRGALFGRLRWARGFYPVVDAVVLLAAFAPSLFSFDARALRALRLFQLIRVMKLARYSRSIRVLGAVIRSKREDIMVTLVVVGVLLVVASTLTYFAEHQAQPEAFSSIPAAMWWAVITLSTVGYGDVYPVTVSGRLIASAIALLGIATFALPAGLLAQGFNEEMTRIRAEEEGVCPRCGRGKEQ